MNVYDFDKTIYDGDSTLDFYFYSLKKNPMLIRFLPVQIIGFLKYMFGLCPKLHFKEKFYSFLKGIKDIDAMVDSFWNNNQSKIKSWYAEERHESDVVISASPEFLLIPICKRIGIKHLIASEVNKKTGVCEGENCYGEQKVLRFKKYFADGREGEINKFYSDSLSDAPISLLAKERYIVRGSNIMKWDEYKPGKIKKLKNVFFSKEFFGFLVVGCINTFNGILCSYIYSMFLDVNISFVCGYITSLTISYLLNTTLVFKEDIGFMKYIKFCISYIPNFIIQNIFVVVFYNLLEWNKLIVFALAAIVGVPITFVIMKFFAFSKKNQPEEIKS